VTHASHDPLGSLSSFQTKRDIECDTSVPDTSIAKSWDMRKVILTSGAIDLPDPLVADFVNSFDRKSTDYVQRDATGITVVKIKLVPSQAAAVNCPLSQ